jgi:hypothetical protein
LEEKSFLTVTKDILLTVPHVLLSAFFGLFIGLILGTFISGSYITVSIILIGPIGSLSSNLGKLADWDMTGQLPKISVTPSIAAGVVAGISYGCLVGVLSGDLAGKTILAGTGGGSGAVITQSSIYLAHRFLPKKYRLVPAFVPIAIVGPIIFVLAIFYGLVVCGFFVIWLLNKLLF